MTSISYNNKQFSTISNTETGDVSRETVFHYHQSGDIVWAEYKGGKIVFGNLIARSDENGILDARYQHLNKRGEIMTGVCESIPEILSDGRIRLREKWQWTCGDHSEGESIVEEILKPYIL